MNSNLENIIVPIDYNEEMFIYGHKTMHNNKLHLSSSGR